MEVQFLLHLYSCIIHLNFKIQAKYRNNANKILLFTTFILANFCNELASENRSISCKRGNEDHNYIPVYIDYHKLETPLLWRANWIHSHWQQPIVFRSVFQDIGLAGPQEMH